MPWTDWGQRRVFHAAVTSVAVVSSGACAEREPPPEGAVAGLKPAAASAPSARPAAARAVIAVVFDQLGSDTLLEHLSFLDPMGAIRTTVAAGAYFERSAYPYATTLTAPGHATIHTGAPPSVSGIDGNSAWDAELEASVPCIRDVRYRVFGREADGLTAGPARLRASTVSHALKAQTGGAARVISLSVKDRSAILSVGTAADVAIWYDSGVGAFTTSEAWGSELPGWLQAYQAARPVASLLTPWLPLSGDYARRLGVDDAPGEGDYYGFGTTFPHGFERVSRPWAVLQVTPALSAYLVELTHAAMLAHGIGTDEVPDLVALSISGTDTAGHIYGPRSWEYVDHLRRADAALGAWLAKIESQIPIAVLITSDHGAPPLPESSSGRGGRVFADEVEARIGDALRAAFGDGRWVAGLVPPYLYLSKMARSSARAGEIRDAALVALRSEPWLEGAWPVSEVMTWKESTDASRRALAASVAPEPAADIMFVPRPYFSFDLGEPRGKGTNHGSPHVYDREVPVLVRGPGVPALRHEARVDQSRVAATLARLLGIEPPASANPEPLL